MFVWFDFESEFNMPVLVCFIWFKHILLRMFLCILQVFWHTIQILLQNGIFVCLYLSCHTIEEQLVCKKVRLKLFNAKSIYFGVTCPISSQLPIWKSGFSLICSEQITSIFNYFIYKQNPHQMITFTFLLRACKSWLHSVELCSEGQAFWSFSQPTHFLEAHTVVWNKL